MEHTGAPNRVRIFKELIKHGAKDHKGKSVLFCGFSAVDLNYTVDNFLGRLFGQTEILQILLRHGADPNCRDKDNITVIEWAMLYGNEACVQFLLDYGINMNDGFGNEKISLLECTLLFEPNATWNSLSSLKIEAKILCGKIIIRHMVKRKCRGLPISPGILKNVSDNYKVIEELDNF